MADVTGTGKSNGIDQFYYTKEVKEHQSQLGKDEFLKIFLTQLQNQDPTSPMENIDSIAQMAQFSSLEAMTNMSNTTTQSQAYGMIGKGIVGTMKNVATGVATDVIGTVESAGIESGKAYVMVGDKKVFMEDVEQVFDNSIIAGEVSTVMAGTNLVGKFARISYTEAGVQKYYEGQVQRISIKDGKLLININENDFLLNQVVNVADKLVDLGTIETPETENPDTQQ